ncbi:MAG: TIGR01777 family oxidoreductase [Gammaproteobacteria bacterium]|nr:TIGR01777 family oxidoreductase [Gammaproteobacteria bacterium]MBQ0840450.1 TIGR01777 family oxidoreductase [Gammaproteobacteria bacterium]
MRILITGGTGFIGAQLCERLLQEQHQLLVLTRRPERVPSPIEAVVSLDQLDGSLYFDVVINLAGEGIASKRWTEGQKLEIVESRLNTTRALIAYFKRAQRKPSLLISGSAIGYYGIGDASGGVDASAPVDEDGTGDESFSSELCQQWEAVAREASELGIRTCLLRTGIVLGRGGALAKMLPPFKLGLGGVVGSGRQWMPWIHRADLVGIILHCMGNETVQGAINGTAPNPVSNREFVRTLGRVLGRPTWLPLPAFIVRLLLGQMGEELLLAGRRIVPRKALDTAYCFQYPHLEPALAQVLGK